MPRPYSRAREKLSDAEYKLATGEGDVRQRLRRAFTVLNRLRSEDLPPELRAEWRAVIAEMTRLGPEKDIDGTVWRSAINHTMSRIRNRTGSKIAQRIHRMYSHICWLGARK